MAVAQWSGSLLDWEKTLARMKARIGGVFWRREVREAAWLYLDGLLSGIKRKTGRQLAEHAGDTQPYRLQGVLGRGRWNADAMRDAVREEVVAALGDAAAVLIVDELAVPKKGRHSVGVAAQSATTVGRGANSQLGIFLGYASPLGQALIDRRLYLPESWAADGARRAKCGVPDDLRFASRGAIARALLARTLDAGVPCAFVLGNAFYGINRDLRTMLEGRRQPYVLAVPAHEQVIAGDAPFRLVTAEAIGQSLDPDRWVAHAALEEAGAPALHDWARVPLLGAPDPSWVRWLLIRRSRETPGECLYFIACARADTPLAELAAVASLRWVMPALFRRARSEVGLDHYEARSWDAWHRHMTLCMAALAFLSVLSADLRRSAMSAPSEPPASFSTIA